MFSFLVKSQSIYVRICVSTIFALIFLFFVFMLGGFMLLSLIYVTTSDKDFLQGVLVHVDKICKNCAVPNEELDAPAHL